MGKWLFPVLLVAPLLGACDYSARDGNRCAGFGFEPGSEGYANCLMQADQGRKAAGATIAAQNPYLRY